MCIGMANGGKQVANDGKMVLLQRAIESAKNRVYYIDVNSMGDISYHHHKKAENQKELMNITVEALEKQIPKKPIEKDEKDYWGNIIDSVYICSECNRFICHGIEIQLEKNYPYCHCGQKIDWSDTE